MIISLLTNRNSLEQSGNMYVFAEVEEEKQKVLKEKAELDEEKGRILQIAQQERIDMLEEKRAFEVNIRIAVQNC